MRRRVLLTGILLAGISASVVTYFSALAQDAETDGSANIAAEVSAVIEGAAARWTAQESESVLELWDQDDSQLMYLAAERDDWLIGWNEVSGYITPSGPNSALEAMRKRVSNIRVKQIAPDLAIATWEMHLDMKFRGRPAIGNNLRLNAVLRQTPKGWRFIHYAEAPMTPLVYIQKFYERDVEPDFEKVYETAIEKRAERESQD